ncbi:hypothetical protein STRDD11_01181 [Streptococcus sp. DD11]|nr:hypothetical protein STRDD11_01181 [Streptococcus sp. DD11]
MDESFLDLGRTERVDAAQGYFVLKVQQRTVTARTVTWYFQWLL